MISIFTAVFDAKVCSGNDVANLSGRGRVFDTFEDFGSHRGSELLEGEPRRDCRRYALATRPRAGFLLAAGFRRSPVTPADGTNLGIARSWLSSPGQRSTMAYQRRRVYRRPFCRCRDAEIDRTAKLSQGATMGYDCRSLRTVSQTPGSHWWHCRSLADRFRG